MTANYNLIETKDGSWTLWNNRYAQHYHSKNDGAITESLYKHVYPALKHHETRDEIRILDICFGLGYNTFMTILQNIKSKNPKRITIFSPELDAKLVEALGNFCYPSILEPLYPMIKSLSKNSFYEDAYHKIEVRIENARDYIKTLSHIDIVYQDAFSSNVNKELWSVEYFRDIIAILSQDAIVTTYSIATPVRLSMSEAGFYLYENKNNATSRATLGFVKKQNIPYAVDIDKKRANNPMAQSIKD